MITAEEHPVITPILMWYIRRKLKRHFHNIRVVGDVLPENVSLLAIGNHISWWDGFFVLHLAQNYLHRKLYVMMLEEQLELNSTLKYGGAFSIKKGSRGVLESIHYTLDLLQKPNNMVLMFPQGKLNSLYSRNFVFEKGLEYLIKNNKGVAPVNLLFIANLIEYGRNPKPELFIHYRIHHPINANTDELAIDYSEFYEQCLDYNEHFILSL